MTSVPVWSASLSALHIGTDTILVGPWNKEATTSGAQPPAPEVFMSRHTVEQYSRVGRAPTAPLPLAKPDAPSQQNESHDRHSRADRGFMLNVFCQLRTCRGCSTSITNVRVSAAGFIATTCRGRHCENGGNNEGCEDRRSGDFLCQGHDRSPFDHWFHYVFASLSRTPGTDAMSGLWSIARISDVAFVTSGVGGRFLRSLR
jgi:hypothetical protein